MTGEQKSIDSIFQTATNGGLPHAWQQKLAVDAEPKNRLIRIPTGMGKTLGVLATWLHHRVIAEDRAWPTRLVWCLPMRTLVEQTRGEAERLVQGLGLTDQVDVHVLMGGVEEHRWYNAPERPKILVGTQDMLLLRALNRDYAIKSGLSSLIEHQVTVIRYVERNPLRKYKQRTGRM